MHPYSIDKKIRKTVVLILFVLSSFVAYFFSVKYNMFFGELKENLLPSFMAPVIKIIFAIDLIPNVIGVMTIYTGMEYLFENFIWKWNIVYKWHKIPNLNGLWIGKLTSSYNKKTIDMEMTIEQTWSEISFKGHFGKSESFSNIAAINVDSIRGVSIYFGFHNESNDVNTCTQSYDGYNILTLKSKDQINAKYFNNRPNPDKKIKGGNIGTYTLNRKE